MLWTIAVLLLILWLLGVVSSYTLGGFIHILLVVAIIAAPIRVIQARKCAGLTIEHSRVRLHSIAENQG